MRGRLFCLCAIFGFYSLAPVHAADVAPGRAVLFQPPKRPLLPAVKNPAWVRNPIDAFVLAKLEAHGLAPNRPADKLRLLRRVTVDLRSHLSRS